MQNNKITSTELFDMLYEKNGGGHFKPEEASFLVKLMVNELLADKKSGFFSYCISIWNNSCSVDKKSKPIDLAKLRSFSVDNSSIFKGDRSFGTRDAYIWITMVEIYLAGSKNKYKVENYYAKNKHLILNKNMCSDDEGRVCARISNIGRLLDIYARAEKKHTAINGKIVLMKNEDIKNIYKDKPEANTEIKPKAKLEDAEKAPIIVNENASEVIEKTEDVVEIQLCDEKNAENIVSDAEKKADIIIDEARKKAEEIIANAEKIENEAKAIRESAKSYYDEQRELIEAERKAIIEKLENESDKYISELREDSLQRQNENNEHYQIDRMEIKQGVTCAREELNKISSELNKILESVEISSKEAVFRQYSYLYNSIYDVYSFLLTQNDVQSKRLCNNLTLFMEIIEENLSEYGIITIKTEENAPFQGKYHKIAGNISDFNPKTAIVTKSLKPGFIWDDVVKEKELVEIIDTSKND